MPSGGIERIVSVGNAIGQPFALTSAMSCSAKGMLAAQAMGTSREPKGMVPLVRTCHPGAAENVGGA